MNKIKLATFVFMSIVWMSSPAYAYLDPGTGSMLLQALIGAVTGVFVVGGIYKAKIMAFFKRSQSEKGEDGPNSID